MRKVIEKYLALFLAALFIGFVLRDYAYDYEYIELFNPHFFIEVAFITLVSFFVIYQMTNLIRTQDKLKRF